MAVEPSSGHADVQRPVTVFNTMTFSAGALSHDTNRATFSTPASVQATWIRSRNSNQSFKLKA